MSRQECEMLTKKSDQYSRLSRLPTPGIVICNGQVLATGLKGLSTAFHNYANVSAADASRLAALLVGQMLPAFSLLAPCDPGASPPEYVTVIVKRSTKRRVAR